MVRCEIKWLDLWSAQTAGPLALDARVGDVTQAFGFVTGRACNEAFDLGYANWWTFGPITVRAEGQFVCSVGHWFDDGSVRAKGPFVYLAQPEGPKGLKGWV